MRRLDRFSIKIQQQFITTRKLMISDDQISDEMILNYFIEKR